jgi:hypothetical protein
MPAARRRRNDCQVVEAGRGAGWRPLAPQDPGDGAGGDTIAEPQQLPADALVAPVWVLGGQPHDHGLHLLGNRWPAAPLRWIGPAPADHAAVPSKQRLGCDHEDRPSGPGQEWAERHQQRAVLGVEPRPWVLAAQNCQLVAEDQDLDLLGVRRPPAEHQQLEKAAQRRVDERPDHPQLQRDDSTRRRTIALLITRPLTCGTDSWHPMGQPGRRLRRTLA